MSRPNLRVRLHKTPSVTDTSEDRAVQAIEELADELGTNPWITLVGEYSGDTPHDSYRDYIEELKNKENNHDAHMSVLLYVRRFKAEGSDDGGGMDAWPNLGAAENKYVSNGQSYAIVNANIRQSDLNVIGDILLPGVDLTSSRTDRFYRNMVKHEILHNLLDSDESVNGQTDHSNGSITRHWLEQRVTPMMSGYGEAGTPNDSPDDPICSDSIIAATNWKSDITDCTEERAKDWLDNEYDRGYGFVVPDALAE